MTAVHVDEEIMPTASHQPQPGPGSPAAAAASSASAQEQTAAIAETLVLAYGLHPAEITRIPEGTATDNYAIVDQTGRQHFGKVYRTDNLDLELASVELSEYAADGGVPTARATRTREHELIATHGRLPMSLWSYVPHTETAEGTLTGARWPAVGAAMGRLHSRLATHPAAAPALEPGAAICDIATARDRFARLIFAYQRRPSLREFEAWALQAARERHAVLGDVESILATLPPLTVQVMHGDLAGPNVLLRNDDVAALVDFGPPTPGYLAWELMRLGCDPKSFQSHGVEKWLTGYTDLALAYRDANPTAPPDDLLSSVRVGCAAMICSAFPLSAPVDRPHLVDAALESYARARHTAALTILEQLPALEEVLHDALR